MSKKCISCQTIIYDNATVCPICNAQQMNTGIPATLPKSDSHLRAYKITFFIVAFLSLFSLFLPAFISTHDSYKETESYTLADYIFTIYAESNSNDDIYINVNSDWTRPTIMFFYTPLAGIAALIFISNTKKVYATGGIISFIMCYSSFATIVTFSHERYVHLGPAFWIVFLTWLTQLMISFRFLKAVRRRIESMQFYPW